MSGCNYNSHENQQMDLMDLFVSQRGLHGHAYSVYWSSTIEHSFMHTTILTCTHTHRIIRSGTYTTRYLKPHKMSKTCNNCINNSKQYTPKEAMAMHTPNVSCESVMSLKPNCTLECTAGLKMAATHSLPAVKPIQYALYSR